MSFLHYLLWFNKPSVAATNSTLHLPHSHRPALNLKINRTRQQRKLRMTLARWLAFVLLDILSAMIIVYWKSETALKSKHILLCSHFVQQQKIQMVIYQRRKGVSELKSYHTKTHRTSGRLTDFWISLENDKLQSSVGVKKQDAKRKNSWVSAPLNCV